jgi:transcriptional regulator with XRE-family HTH domain
MIENSSTNAGGRVRSLRTDRGWSQKKLAQQTGIDQQTLSRYENGRRLIGEVHLKLLADKLEVEVEVITGGMTRLQHYAGETIKNPKPIVGGPVSLENVYLVCGNHIEPLEISIAYRHSRLKIPKKIEPVYLQLAALARTSAEKAGYPYFNGPNTRLLRVTESNTRQLATGREQRGVNFELGPVSWEEYTVLNEFLDFEVFNEKTTTIRKALADERQLFDNCGDLRWCQLSNILCIAAIPITNDGFGLIQHRSRQGVSSDIGRLTSGVAENIHRFLDEAAPENLGKRLHTLTGDGGRAVDADYQPRGVPSPLLTALRGVFEEVSTETYRRIKDSKNRLIFLNVIFELAAFHPMLVGVINLGISRAEIEDVACTRFR